MSNQLDVIPHVNYTATWAGEGRAYQRLCPIVPHHYSDMGHLLAWPSELIKLEYKGVVAKFEDGAFVTDDWKAAFGKQMEYSNVLLSNTELGQILIHAQRARYIVAIHEEGR